MRNLQAKMKSQQQAQAQKEEVNTLIVTKITIFNKLERNKVINATNY